MIFVYIKMSVTVLYKNSVKLLLFSELTKLFNHFSLFSLVW